MARPVVSTDVGDVARFIENGKSGIVVPIDCASALAAGIARFLQDGPLRGACGEQARMVAVSHFDVEVCVQKHAQCYREMLSDKKVGSQCILQETIAPREEGSSS